MYIFSSVRKLSFQKLYIILFCCCHLYALARHICSLSYSLLPIQYTIYIMYNLFQNNSPFPRSIIESSERPELADPPDKADVTRSWAYRLSHC